MLQNKMTNHTWPRQFRVFFAINCCVIFCLPDALAEPGVHPYLTDKFIAQVGVYFPQQDIKLRLDGSAGNENGEIHFDEQLNLRDDDDIFVLEMMWRFGEKWSLRMQNFQENRRSTAVLEEDIEWGDEVIQAGSSVSAGTNIKVTRIFFARAFDTDPQVEYGIGLGVHWLETGGFIGVEIIDTVTEFSAVSASGPLPNIGAWYYYSPSEKWYLGGRLDWLEVSLGDYAGRLINFSVGTNYQLTRHFGVGMNYQVFSLAADIKKSSWHGRIELIYDGLYFNLSGNW
jgi:hypothetical protein